MPKKARLRRARRASQRPQGEPNASAGSESDAKLSDRISEPELKHVPDECVEHDDHLEAHGYPEELEGVDVGFGTSNSSRPSESWADIRHDEHEPRTFPEIELPGERRIKAVRFCEKLLAHDCSEEEDDELKGEHSTFGELIQRVDAQIEIPRWHGHHCDHVRECNEARDYATELHKMIRCFVQHDNDSAGKVEHLFRHAVILPD